MSVRFEFELSDEEAQDLVDILTNAKLGALDRSYHDDNPLHREWWRLRAPYLLALAEKVAKGSRRV